MDTRQCSVPSGAQGRSSPSPAVSFPNKPASAADQSSCTCPATPPAGTLSPELNVRRTWGMEQGKKGEGDRKSAPLLLAKDQRQSLTWGSPNLDDRGPHKSVVSSHPWTPAPCGDGCTKSSGKRHLQDKVGSGGPTAALDWKVYQTRFPTPAFNSRGLQLTQLRSGFLSLDHLQSGLARLRRIA